MFVYSNYSVIISEMIRLFLPILLSCVIVNEALRFKMACDGKLRMTCYCNKTQMYIFIQLFVEFFLSSFLFKCNQKFGEKGRGLKSNVKLFPYKENMLKELNIYLVLPIVGNVLMVQCQNASVRTGMAKKMEKLLN